jgi:signal transduction histidine kinase
LASLSGGANEATRETLSAIAQCAREALDDVRRLLVVMRSEGSIGPQPGLTDLPRLLAGMTAAGLQCDLVIEGAARPLSAALDLSAYRVVQEALTNTMRHSREATARVLISYLNEALVIDVTDDGRTLSGHQPRGFGLLGMRERVAVFGGEVQAGTRPEGGFAIHVKLPTRGGDGHAIAGARL